MSKKQNYKRGTNESLKNKNYKGWRLMRVVNELKNISFVRQKSMHKIEKQRMAKDARIVNDCATLVR